MKKIILLSVGLLVVVIFSIFLIHDSKAFFSTMLGASIGFLGGLIIYQIGSYVDEESKSIVKRENTIHIYNLYKSELNMNLDHLKHITEKKGQIPFFKLKSITRNSLWGQLSAYSRDTDLMEKLNYIYGEFELINNKIDIMNAARLAEKSALTDKDKQTLNQEIAVQLGGVVELSKKVKPHIKGSLEKIGRLIEEAHSETGNDFNDNFIKSFNELIGITNTGLVPSRGTRARN